MKVTFWGTRGSTPVPGKDTIIYGGNTTCLEIDLAGGKKVIVDAGTGIRALGSEFDFSDNRLELYLLITHIHWDHVFGFPFFQPIYKSSTKILVDGYSQCMKGLRYSFDNKMGDGFFPIRFEELNADIQFIDKLSNGYLEIDGTIIHAIPLRHPQGGLGFRFREGDKTLVFLTDNELDDDRWAFEGYVGFCERADVLIHDSHYVPEEISKHRGWGHSDYLAAIDLAVKAHVRKLILFHHAPERKDSDVIKMVLDCQELIKEKGTELSIEAAKENSAFEL
ncbi:MAG: MBL fold metallo-hydrolase [Deltaproteobacteria bacterium]|nr:MBL fold metallo-hydrolase [Deltaproteobacteria bacterium]MBW2309711.1 MBL fold metallo-hydrolase [Deltaproteobacteria bacterium]